MKLVVVSIVGSEVGGPRLHVSNLAGTILRRDFGGPTLNLRNLSVQRGAHHGDWISLCAAHDT